MKTIVPVLSVPPARRSVEPEKPPTEPVFEASNNVLIAFGDLLRDHKTTGDLLRTLLADPDRFSGTCRTVLSLLRQMEKSIEKIIIHSQDAD